MMIAKYGILLAGALALLAQAASAQNAGAGRAESALSAGYARPAAAQAAAPSATPPGSMSESERGEMVKAIRRLEERAGQLGQAQVDLSTMQAKYDRLQARASNAKFSDRDRRAATERMAETGRMLALAKSQAVEHARTKQLAAAMDTQLAQDEAAKKRALGLVRDTDPRALNRQSLRSQRYGSKQDGPTRPMSPADRAAYQQRFQEWKTRLKQLEAQNPDGVIDAVQTANFNLGNHLASPVLTPETRLAINDRIGKNQLIIDQNQPISKSLRYARRVVFQMDNELMRDDDRKIRLAAGGAFSDPRHATIMAKAVSPAGKPNSSYKAVRN